MAALNSARRALAGLSSAARPSNRALDSLLFGASGLSGRHGTTACTSSGTRNYASDSSASTVKNFGPLGLLARRLPATSTGLGLSTGQLASNPILRPNSLQTRLQSSSSGSEAQSEESQRPSGGLAAEMLAKKMAGSQKAADGRKTAESEANGEQPESEQEQGEGLPPPPPEAPKNALAAWASIVFMGGVGVVLVTGWPEQGDSWTGGWFTRSGKKISSLYAHITEPSDLKLLPDPLPEPYNRPYTLVINLNDTLVHMDWTREHGWRAAKRPGIDYFISYLSQMYEIVVFTTSQSFEAHPLIDKLDPYGHILYRLYREATRYENGVYVKDLSHLNRDLSKVVAVDIKAEALKEQPENLLMLKAWDGSGNDSTLLDIIPFLETLALSGVDDVRPILKSYEGKDIPKTFAEWQKNLRQDYEEKQRRALSQSPGGGRAGIFSRLLGGGASPLTQAAPNPFDIIEAQTREMREQFLKEQEQMRRMAEEHRQAQIAAYEKQMAEMKEKKMSLMSWFAQQQQAPGGQPEQAK